MNESGPRIELKESQDRSYVADGDDAVVTIQVLADGKPAPEVKAVGAHLVKLEGSPALPSSAVEAVELKDDGVAPDEQAGDATLTGVVSFKAAILGGFVGATQLNSTLELGDTRFDSVLGFTYTGPPPARFTGKVTAAIEKGSLVFHMGFEVTNEGDYVVRGRLYDGAGSAVALMDASGSYRRTDHEVRLVAFGLLLRDEGAESPFELRDVEAWRTVSGFPDRQKVLTWVGPYETRKYDLGDFSDEEWTTPDKERQVALMRQRIEQSPP